MEGITLDKLFRASKTIELPDGAKVTVRALSDAEKRQRAMASLRASVRLDEKLDDPTSDEYAVYLLPLKKSSKEDLLDIMATWQKDEATRLSLDEYKNEYLPFPEKATDDERRETLKQREASERETDKKRVEFVEKRVEEFRDKAEQWDEAKLLKEAIARKKLLAALQETLNEDAYQSVFMGTEVKGKHYFKSVDEVRQLDSAVLIYILSHQREVDSLDVWELTKIRPGRGTDGLVDSNQAPAPEP